MIGWQIRRVKTDAPPPGVSADAVFGYNYVLTFVWNAADRAQWRLLPVGDLEAPDPKAPRPLDDASEALKFVKKYNAALARRKGKS